MRNVHTAPMEVFAQISNGTYELEPYEVGWAAEALAMVYVREAHGDGPYLYLTAQISNGTYELEPYEAGWAAEALAMVYVREAHGDAPQLRLIPQISVDGVRWIDTPHRLWIHEPGGYSLLLTGFGNWLRLAGEASGGPTDGPAFVADFYWVLKS